MSEFNGISRLAAEGMIAGASPEQRAVLAALSEAEVNVLISVKHRLDVADPDVRAHQNGDGGVFH